MTLNDILRIYRTPISVIPDFQGPDQPYRAYRGRADAGWMREEPWKMNLGQMCNHLPLVVI